MSKRNQVDMVTACGHIVNFGLPGLTIIDLSDIEIHTKNICRYQGALQWRLIQHLALCTKLAENQVHAHREQYNSPKDPRELVIQTAFCASHDFHEVYVGDVVSGLKKYLPAYREIEACWEEYVHEQLGLPFAIANKDFVRYVDTRALVIEMHYLAHPAASLVADRYGGEPTGNELQIINRIDGLDLDQAWNIARNAFLAGRKEYIARAKLDVELL